MVILATHVKQAVLVGIGGTGRGKVKCAVHAFHQGCTVQVNAVKRTRLDEGFHAALVQAAAVYPAGKVKQALERTGLLGGAPAFARRHNRLDGLLAGPLDGTQTVADFFVGDGLKAVDTAVDIGRLKTQPHLFGILEQHLQLVGVVHFHRHVGAEELGRVVHLDPGRVVGQERVGGGVRLVEAVARKLFHQVKDFVGLFFADVVFGRTGAEDGAVLGHLLGLLLAHGATQHVGAAQRVAAQNLGGLHHLLLVDHDAVGLAEHVGHCRVRVLDFFPAVLACHETRDQVHGARAVQRVQRNQVFQPAGLGIHQHALHAHTFKLEHGFGLALGEQAVDLGIVERQVLVGKVFLAGVALHDELARDLQDGECGQPQEVELHQANRLHIVLVVLTDCRFAAGLLVERAKIGQLARGDEHTAGVHADVAGHALQLAGQLQQGLDVFFFGLTFGQQRLSLTGIDVFVILLAVGRRQLQRDVGARLVGNELGNAIAKGVAHVQHTPHIAHHTARGHGAESGNLAHGVLAVLVLHIVDHQVAVGLAKVDVKVGHGHPLGVQKPLEQQVVLQRVQVGNLERIRHQTAGTRAPAWPHRAAIVFGPVDEVAHDQKVTREAHLQNGGQLKLQALHITRHLRLALVRLGVEMAHALLQSLERRVAEILFRRHALAIDLGRGKHRQLGLAQHQGQAAALGNLQRVGNGRGNVGKQCLHLGRALEILLARETAHPLGVAQNLAIGNTHTCLVRFKVVRLGELDGVRRHHRQHHAGGQLHRGNHMGLVIGAAGALHLQVKAVREHAGQLHGSLVGACGVALHQRLAHRTSLCTGQANESFVQFLEPGHLDHGLVLHHVLGKGAGNQLRDVQIPLLVLHQHDDTRHSRRVGPQAFNDEFRPDQGFDAFAATLFVELDGTKQVV